MKKSKKKKIKKKKTFSMWACDVDCIKKKTYRASKLSHIDQIGWITNHEYHIESSKIVGTKMSIPPFYNYQTEQ